MAVNENSDLLIKQYIRRYIPELEESIQTFIQGELQGIEASIRSLTDGSVQTTDQAPAKPKRGMVRFSTLPWNPLSNNAEGLVVYNGSAWVAV